MSDETLCPRCGARLAAGATAGECPRCLLAAGLESAESLGTGAASVPGAGDGPGAAGADAPSPRPLPTAPSPAEIGAHFPQLDVLELLGQGGMGIVYKARQKSLDRLVALKVMPPEAAREPGFADRFTREARTLARLQHPNIVAIHDFGVSAGLYFLLMEYVDGANLRQAMREGRLTPAQALAIVPQVCDALQYAHENGVVHRDVKPENILIDRAGRVRIADFGLAKIVQRTPVDVTITRAGQVMGTLHYMAPEQVRTPDAVDHRADIYSLGVVFYEMLTGELPLGSFPPPSERSSADVRLDRVVMRALEGERERRWQHASEMKDRMTAIAAGPDAPAPAAGVPAPRAAPTAAAAVPLASPDVAPARPSRLATAGALGVPVGVVLALALWAFAHFAPGGGALGTPLALLPLAVVFAGWVVSIVAWARIHHAGGALGGKAWAVTGTFLPFAFLCCGGPVVYLSSTAPPGITVQDGAGGTRVRLPGIDVEERADGTTRVDLPGIHVDERDDGTHVRLPGIEVHETDGTTRVRVSGVAVQADDRAQAANVTGGPANLTDEDRAALVATMRLLWKSEGGHVIDRFSAEDGARPFAVAHPAAGFEFFHLALSEDGRSGRLVLTDFRHTIAFRVATDGAGWSVRSGGEEHRDSTPSTGDRDGWLSR